MPIWNIRADVIRPVNIVSVPIPHAPVKDDALFDDVLRIGRTRVINPGALFRASEKTVALLDTDTDRLEYVVMG